MNRLEDVIRSQVMLDQPHGTGFCPVLCPVCSDHGKKGKRAGFKFDGDVTIYSCFNCGIKAVYDPNEHGQLSHKMMQILTSFGIQESDLNGVMFHALEMRNKPTGALPTPEKQMNLTPATVQLPDHFYKLGTRDNAQSELAEIHLEEKRGMTSNDYTFYMSDYKDWKARLIIPIYRNNKLIFYQGRDLLNSRSNKYKSVNTPRDCIFYGYDQIDKYSQDPLFIVEGFFDAYVIDGIATLSNELTTQQTEILRRCPRPKVVIPDRRGNGFVLANQAIKEGWSVAFPDIGGCKDVSEAVQKYGKLYVLKSIAQKTKTAFEAALNIKSYCK